MGDLKSFLIDLALNADLAQAYSRDPRATLDRAGLSDGERAAMASGNSAALRTALGRPDNDCMSQTGVKVRDKDTGRVLSLAQLLPLEKSVMLPVSIEMDLADGSTRTYAKGSTVVRHRRITNGAPKKRGRVRTKKAKAQKRRR